MSVIPRYWYCESFDSGEAFQLLPTEMARICPEPLSSADETCLLVNPHTGEIEAEAILMSALPFPRFRCFGMGKEVILPHRTAISLERYEAEYLPSFIEIQLGKPLDKQRRASLKYRMEHINLKRYAFTPICDGHWLSPLTVSI